MQPVQIENFYREMTLLGTLGHERLSYSSELSRPITCQKPNWFQRLLQLIYKPQDKRLQTIVSKTLSYFAVSQDEPVSSSMRLQALLAFKSIVNKTRDPDLNRRYQGLVDVCLGKVERDAAVKLSQLEANYRSQESLLKTNYRTLEDQLKQGLKTKETELNNELIARQNQHRQALSALGTQKEQVEDAIKLKQEELERTKEAVKLVEDSAKHRCDTVLSGADGDIFLPWIVLEKANIKFFLNDKMKQERAKALSDNPNTPFKIDFKEYTQETLRLFNYFWLSGSLPRVPVNDLFELLKFTDYIGDATLGIAIFDALRRRLTVEDARQIVKDPNAEFIPGLKPFAYGIIAEAEQKKRKTNQSEPKQPQIHAGKVQFALPSPIPDQLLKQVLHKRDNGFDIKLIFVDRGHIKVSVTKAI